MLLWCLNIFPKSFYWVQIPMKLGTVIFFDACLKVVQTIKLCPWVFEIHKCDMPRQLHKKTTTQERLRGFIRRINNGYLCLLICMEFHLSASLTAAAKTKFAQTNVGVTHALVERADARSYWTKLLLNVIGFHNWDCCAINSRWVFRKSLR